MSKTSRFKFILSMIGILALIIAAIQNSQSIPVHFLVWHAQIDGLLLFLVLFVFGFLVGAMFSMRPKKE